MSTTMQVTELLNGMLGAVSTVIPMPTHRQTPSVFEAPTAHVEMGVLIGVTGQVGGQVVLTAAPDVFGRLAAGMFGMHLEGEMLASFVGELGNMIAGTMCTNVARDGILIDITPPTVIVGDTRLSGFTRVLSLPVQVDQVGELQVLLIFEN